MNGPSWLLTIWNIILSGGPIMLALLLLAFLLYRNLLGTALFTIRLDAPGVFQEQSEDRSRSALQAFRSHLAKLVKTQLAYAKVLIVAAPLLGLLGTVMGMLDTFRGIGAEAGSDTTKTVADGVKVALITTQTGLMIAIFGVFFTQAISRLHRSKDQQLLELEIEMLRKGIEL